MNRKHYSQLGFMAAVVILTAFFGLMWAYTPPNETFPIEESDTKPVEDPEMKYDQFAAVDGTNDDLEDLQNFRNLGYYNGNYYWAEVSGTTFYIKYTDALTGSTSTLTSKDVTTYPVGPTQPQQITTQKGIVCKYVYDPDSATHNILAGLIFWDALAGYTYLHILSYDITNTTAYDDIVDLGAVVNGDAFLADVFYDTFDDTYSFVDYFEVVAATTYYVESRQYTHAGGISGTSFRTTLQLDDPEAMWVGHFDATNNIYNFVVKDSAANIRLYNGYLDGTALDYETLTGITAPTSWNVAVQLYWKQDNVEIIMDEDHLNKRINNGDWVNIEEVGTTTNAVILNEDGTIWGVVFKDAIFYWTPSGALVKIQSFTGDAYVGYKTSTDPAWFANGADTIYQIELTEITQLQKCNVFSKLYYPTWAEIICGIEPFAQQYLILYNDNGELILEDYITEYESNGYIYRWLIGPHPDCRKPSGAQYIDLNEKVNESYTAQTAHAILKDILDNYAKFFWYDAGIDTTPSDIYTINFKDKTMLQCIQTLDKLSGYQTSWRQDHEIYWDEYSDASWDYKIGNNTVQWGTAVTPDLSDFTDDTYLSVVAEYGNAKNVLKFEHSAAMSTRLPLTQSTSVTFECFLQRTSTGAQDPGFLIDNGADAACFILYVSPTTVRVYHAATYTDITVTTNKRVHIHGIIDCDTDTQTVYIDGIRVVSGVAFYLSATLSYVNNLRLYLSGEAIGYIDAFGWSSDGYTPRALLWTPSNDANCTTTVTDVGGRYRVLDLYDNNAAGIAVLTTTFTAQTSGTFIFYVRSDDVTDQFVIYFYSGVYGAGTIGPEISIDTDKFQYYYGGAFNDATNGAVSNDIYYKCKIIFDCAADTYDFYVNDILLDSGIVFRNVLSNIDAIRLATWSADSGYHYYVKVVYCSWEPQLLGYNEYQLTDFIGPLFNAPMAKPDKVNYGRFIIHGGYLNGSRLKSEIINDPNLATLIEEEPSITNQTDLDALCTTLSTRENATIIKYKIPLGNRGIFSPGQQIYAWLLAQFSVYAEWFYCVESNYDGLINENLIIFTDDIWQPPLGSAKETKAETKANNNEVMISQVETRVEINQRGINTIAADDTTPDVSGGSIFITSANTGATAITDLDNPTVGQIITLIGGSDTNASTITDGGNFRLSGNMTLGAGDSIMLLVYTDNDYWELSRTTV